MNPEQGAQLLAVVKALLPLAECEAEGRCALVDSIEAETDAKDATRICTDAQAIIARIEGPQPKLPTDWVCPTCGSDEIQTPAWVWLNTGVDTCDEGPVSGYYCIQCEELFGEGHITTVVARSVYEGERDERPRCWHCDGTGFEPGGRDGDTCNLCFGSRMQPPSSCRAEGATP
jgi:hypothetical protein